MTPLTTLRTAQLFQMSCPLISSGVGIRIGSTTAAWLAEAPSAPAAAADGSGEAILHYHSLALLRDGGASSGQVAARRV
uniref:Uncharacterized protein n=1 Tax=Oryza brachyantha TaxID=4533 RepID=J3LMV3_ORYBR